MSFVITDSGYPFDFTAFKLNEQGFMDYVKHNESKDGKGHKIITPKYGPVLMRLGTGIPEAEYQYLLGQTVPYHVKGRPDFDIRKLAYVLDESGKPKLWTSNQDLFRQFFELGQKMSFIYDIYKRPDGKLFAKCNPLINRVVHREPPTAHDTPENR